MKGGFMKWSLLALVLGAMICGDCYGCDDPYRLATDGIYYPVPPPIGIIQYGQTIYLNPCPEPAVVEVRGRRIIIHQPRQRDSDPGIPANRIYRP